MNFYTLLTSIIFQPLPASLIVSGVVLVGLWRRRRESRVRLGILAASLLLLASLSTRAVVYPLVGSLEWSYPPSRSRPAGTDAIVVLSAGGGKPSAWRPWHEPSASTVRRCLHAAELYHDGQPCPIVVTGGAVDPSSGAPPDAPTMRDLLLRLGVKGQDILLESRSRSTYENAAETRKILEERGLKRAALVTEATHMPRSLASFRKQGVDVIPAACGHVATEFEWNVGNFLPSIGALGDFMLVFHEWLGLAWYKVRGRI